jgi:(2Fe-2S) ferredoxin
MSADTSPLDIPQVYKLHAFLCFQDRPPGHPRGSCGQKGAKPLWDHLMQVAERKGLREIGLTASGCLGFCSAGPLMVCYPQGIWYAPRTREDIDEIVQSHLIDGTPVERLIIVPRL